MTTLADISDNEMMFHKLSAAALVSPFALLSNAVVIKMFHGRDC